MLPFISRKYVVTLAAIGCAVVLITAPILIIKHQNDSLREKADTNLKVQVYVCDQLTELFESVNVPEDFARIGDDARRLMKRNDELKREFASMEASIREDAMAVNKGDLDLAECRLIYAKRRRPSCGGGSFKAKQTMQKSADSL